ncbi:MAG: hypothetical protein ACE5Q6_02755 [Dehalococcoidia bacterium]
MSDKNIASSDMCLYNRVVNDILVVWILGCVIPSVGTAIALGLIALVRATVNPNNPQNDPISLRDFEWVGVTLGIEAWVLNEGFAIASVGSLTERGWTIFLLLNVILLGFGVFNLCLLAFGRSFGGTNSSVSQRTVFTLSVTIGMASILLNTVLWAYGRTI